MVIQTSPSPGASRRTFLGATLTSVGMFLAGCNGKTQKPATPSNTNAQKAPAISPPMIAGPARTAVTPVSVPQGAAIKQLTLSGFNGGITAAKRLLNKARNGFFKLFGKVLPKGIIIAKSPSKEAVSEGIGFGGLITSSTNAVGSSSLVLSSNNNLASQAMYWQLRKARRAYFLKSSGVMAWKVDLRGRKTGKISASDGDQDWIASTLMVYDKLKQGTWKMPSGMSLAKFKKEIQKDLQAFWKAHIKVKNGRHIFLTTDGKWAQRGDGRDVYYASYPDPHFLRVFAKFDRGRAWDKVARDVQLLNKEILKNYKTLGAIGQNPMPAKVFVRVTTTGKFVVDNYYKRSKAEGVRGTALIDNETDSIRFFLRMARAAVLDKDKDAQIILKQIVRIAKITTTASAYILAGAKGAPHRFGFNNTVARAAYGIAVLGSNNVPLAEKFIITVLKNSRGDFFGEWAGAKKYYYDQALILQFLDLAIYRK